MSLSCTISEILWIISQNLKTPRDHLMASLAFRLYKIQLRLGLRWTTPNPTGITFPKLPYRLGGISLPHSQTPSMPVASSLSGVSQLLNYMVAPEGPGLGEMTVIISNLVSLLTFRSQFVCFSQVSSRC